MNYVTAPYSKPPQRSTERSDDFAKVPRPLLKLGRGRRGWRFDCAVLARVEYLHHFGRRTIDVADLAQRAGVHRRTARRSLRRLVRDGWLRDDLRRNFDKPLPPNPKNTFVHVRWEQLRELGTEDAFTEAQLEAMPPTAQLEDGRMCAPPALLSTLLGQHRDTARASVRRLAAGDTLKARQRRRAGDTAPHVPRLRLELGWGGAPAFVLRTPHERLKLRRRLDEARAAKQKAEADKTRSELEKAMREAGVEPPKGRPQPSSPSAQASRSRDAVPTPEALAHLVSQGMRAPPPLQAVLREMQRKPTN